MRVAMQPVLKILVPIGIAISLISPGLAHSEGKDDGFMPTWKLFKSEEKRQFIAGYLYGWSDASRMTDVAIEYVRDNPTKALDGLERIKSVYDMSGMQADTIVSQLNGFFADPTNKDATLSQAITAVRQSMGR